MNEPDASLIDTQARGPTPGPRVDVSLDDTMAPALSDDRSWDADTVGSAGPSRQLRTQGLEMPRKIGRHTVLNKLGAGGMGVVYAAYDPELDRKVAIKLMRVADDEFVDTTAAAEAQARFLREAQAMARVDHPNVISVYDVGTFVGQVYIAMEFVDGQTLGDWARVEGRTWKDILDAYRSAGEGLSAAHDVGLVHRDFKPDNALIGHDGRVRVLDFGLVRSLDEAVEAVQQDAPAASMTASTLTRVGAVMGTPAYMSPEQFAGEVVDARSDQFSFFVSLWDGLFGERPFSGSTFAELAASVTSGKTRPMPKSPPIPTFVRRAIARGLAAKPDERFASMREVLAELARDPARNMRLLAGGAMLIAAVGAAAVSSSKPTRIVVEGPKCEAGDDRLSARWGPEQRDAVRSAFEATEVVYASRSFDAVNARFDEWGDAWAGMYVDACEATHVRGEQSELMLDRRMGCLDDRLDELEMTVAVLSDADAAMMPKAVQAAFGLEAVDRCADTERLLAQIEPPSDPAVREEVDSIRKQIAKVRATYQAGRFGPGLELATATRKRAEATDYDPIIADALYHEGSLLVAAGKYEESEAPLERAFDLALASGDDDVMTRSAAVLTTSIGTRLGRIAEGMRWSNHAQAAVTRFGDEGDILSRVINSRATLLGRDGKHEEAQRLSVAALEVRRKALGDDHPYTGFMHLNLGIGYVRLHRPEDAIASLRTALSILEPKLGAEHPHVLANRNAIGVAARTLGDFDLAVEMSQASFDAQRRVLGPEHPTVALTMMSLAGSLGAAGRFDDGIAMMREAIASRTKSIGAEHRDTLSARLSLAVLLFDAGRLEEAERDARATLSAMERIPEPQEDDRGGGHHVLAGIARDQQRWDVARREAAAAARIWAKLHGEGSVRAIEGLERVADIALRSGRVDEARKIFERAHAGLDETADKRLRSLVAAGLALSIPDDPARAADLAKQAIELARGERARTVLGARFSQAGLSPTSEPAAP
jgi:tetratricopeptide (TPR) repeat protein/predicted Ser/Thr protein kinase